MNKKQWLILTGLLVAGISLWAGRIAWRVHRQVVSLDVRNLPLAEVLHKIERQTWKKIRAENALNARITLRVAEMPLSQVLDRIAAQAGVRWSTVYAVYGSRSSLSALDSALRSDGKLEPAGWSKIAPNAEDFAPGKGANRAEHLRINPLAQKEAAVDALAGPLPDAAVAPPPDGLGPISPPDTQGPGERQERKVMIRRGDGGSSQVMFFGGATGEMQMWSPEELVLESALTNHLNPAAPLMPNAKDAAEVSRKISGRWTSFVAFKKSNFGVGFGGLPPAPGRHGLEGGPGDENARFTTLTPAQRVQRARERISWKKEVTNSQN
ncbi:MAG TPA: hypothetical protein VFL42_14760 [Terriglobales bacterium]|nr:hypothetical protein [Terriglobales bacterium]